MPPSLPRHTATPSAAPPPVSVEKPQRWREVKAMVLHAAGAPLEERELERPTAAAGQLLIEVASCGVCRTDLHVVDGELPHPKLPLVPGHQIVGRTQNGRRVG